jgi:hypothetical protein
MSDAEVAALQNAALAFAARVTEWSGGAAGIAVYAPVVVADPVTQIEVLTREGPADDVAYLGTGDIKKHLDALLVSGDYDSVLVFWHAGPGQGGTSFRTDVGDTQYLQHAGEQIIYSVLALNGGVLTEPVRGEAVLHEWLHGVDDFYEGLGYRVPDSDEAAGYGYADSNGESTLGGFEAFYRDLLSGRIVTLGDEYTGATRAVWASARSTGGTRSGATAERAAAAASRTDARSPWARSARSSSPVTSTSMAARRRTSRRRG